MKPTYLARQGHEVINPRPPDEDFEAAVRIAQADFDKRQPQAVAPRSGSGMTTNQLAPIVRTSPGPHSSARPRA